MRRRASMCRSINRKKCACRQRLCRFNISFLFFFVRFLLFITCTTFYDGDVTSADTKRDSLNTEREVGDSVVRWNGCVEKERKTKKKERVCGEDMNKEKKYKY